MTSLLAHGDAGGSGLTALHVAALAVWVPVFLAWRLLDRRRSASPVARRAVTVAAGASLAAGLVHLAVVPEHWTESPLYGAFFAGAVVAQLGAAVLLARRPTSWLCAATVAGQLALTGVWVLTRTAGIPLGPEAGMVEPVGLLDTTCVVAQVISAGACAVALWARPPRVVASLA